MPISMYSLIQTMAKAQFAQDAYAVFQGTEESTRHRRAKEAMDQARAAEQRVEEIKEVDDTDAIRIDKDSHGNHGNFSEFFELVKKRFEEHKRNREAHPEEDAEDSGKVIDLIG